MSYNLSGVALTFLLMHHKF